eukprot:1159127-Pelagomonas_calceolata.AAC.2
MPHSSTAGSMRAGSVHSSAKCRRPPKAAASSPSKAAAILQSVGWCSHGDTPVRSTPARPSHAPCAPCDGKP